MKPLRIAVVGVGSLGQHHARILAGMPGVKLVGVVDPNAKQAETIAAKHDCKVFANAQSLKSEIDAVSIVTPTKFHCSTAIEFLAAGIPCLVEKPLAGTVPEAKLIVNAAKRAKTTLQVGHIERFNPGFTVVEKSCLCPKFIEAQRLAPFSGRALDVGVVLDLMIHDLDLILSLTRSPIVSVDAIGVSIMGLYEDMANVRLHFANGCIASLTASRVHPQAVRTMNIFGSEGYAGIDFGKKACKLVQPSLSFRNGVPEVRNLDPQSMARFKENLFTDYLQTEQTPESKTDQLTVELADFIDCVKSGKKPKVTGEDGLAAVSLAHSILDNIAAHDWEGNSHFFGPTELPIHQGPLFHPQKVEQEMKQAA